MAKLKRLSKSWRLPDELWEVLEPLLPKRQKRSKRGRPSSDLRNIADGIFMSCVHRSSVESNSPGIRFW
jgi:transposase